MTLKDFKLLLDEKVNNNSQVFIVPHLGVDFDAIASCLAMDLIIKKIGKNSYIIIEEDSLKLEPGVKVIINELKKSVNIINMENIDKLRVIVIYLLCLMLIKKI